MNKLNKNLSDIIDVEPLIESPLVMSNNTLENIELSQNAVIGCPVQCPVPQTELNPITKTQLEDIEFARDNIKNLITKGNDALDKLIHIAKESEHPRAYEVFSGLIKNLSELNKDLLELHKKKKDITTIDQKNINVDAQNAIVFAGSSKELLKLIKQNKE